ncbi:hypothetical protein CAPTEDRAFT_199186 [Capitella teleta]|uniref:Somatostatin/Cortistatin C-terminal domain-containing protein n=1 Tax=Capitella teleta TaxID=283909 RepID=R7VD28_CAPTE|nr:hypothetical protein CAPTEDRAFT_199186 [Capitella teleta]|eukprot:ELU16723.1 hypothetical protein CAPTEDRAFT_199186 [Capitella teleta]
MFSLQKLLVLSPLLLLLVVLIMASDRELLSNKCSGKRKQLEEQITSRAQKLVNKPHRVQTLVQIAHLAHINQGDPEDISDPEGEVLLSLEDPEPGNNNPCNKRAQLVVKKCLF